jgi:hypothetical protein
MGKRNLKIDGRSGSFERNTIAVEEAVKKIQAVQPDAG